MFTQGLTFFHGYGVTYLIDVQGWHIAKNSLVEAFIQLEPHGQCLHSLLVSDTVKVIKREEQNQIKAAEIVLPPVPLIHTVVVFQVLGKSRCNVTPHNAQ
jgi:hypothetical protein